MAVLRKTPWLDAALLLGSFSFGYNLHTILHELGHCVAIWVQGGSIHGFVLHPFLASYAPSTYVPDHILLYLGGALFGGTSTVLFAFLAWRYRSPYLMPFVMACAAGLITTARWMLVAPFTASETDYYYLITLAVSPSIIFLWGLAFLIIGLVVFILYLPLVGVSSGASFSRYLAVIVAGILPYQIVAGMYRVVVVGSSLSGAVSRVIVEAVVLVVLAWLSKSLAGRISFLQSVDPVVVTKRHAAVVWVAMVLLIVTMLVVSMSRDAVI